MHRNEYRRLSACSFTRNGTHICDLALNIPWKWSLHCTAQVRIYLIPTLTRYTLTLPRTRSNKKWSNAGISGLELLGPVFLTLIDYKMASFERKPILRFPVTFTTDTTSPVSHYSITISFRWTLFFSSTSTSDLYCRGTPCYFHGIESTSFPQCSKRDEKIEIYFQRTTFLDRLAREYFFITSKS